MDKWKRPELTFSSKSVGDLILEHQIEVNPVSGAAMISVPLPLTPGRFGFGPALALQYESSAGNSVFGLGWSLAGIPCISLSPEKSPRYDGNDGFFFNGSEELVPALSDRGGAWEPVVFETTDFWIHAYRRKYEKDYVRFEQWVEKETGRIHWRSRDKDNSVSVYGLHASGLTRLANPEDPQQTCQWLLEAQVDDHGNGIRYEYLSENAEGVDGSCCFEFQRLNSAKGFARRYLKRVLYGNTLPLTADAPEPADNAWLFAAVLDYGDHAGDGPPAPEPVRAWPARADAYSDCRPGFEVRTYRLCRRLMLFHHFPELGAAGTAVGAIQFAYREEPAGTKLEQIRYTGYRLDPAAGGYSQHSLPPLVFTYAAPRMGACFHPVSESSLLNLPQGLSGMRYRWLDLYGEGLPGILTEAGRAWYYKSNQGQGCFGPQRLVGHKPSGLTGREVLNDFDGDGNLNLVALTGREAGYFEYDRDQEQWNGYRSFALAPVLDMGDPKIHWIDLNQDGYADVIVSHSDRFTWYPSEGKAGFGPPQEFAKPCAETGTSVQAIAEDMALQSMFADMNGDGQTDQVRIQNGRVEYWPQLGNGRFGAGVVMENAPIFDFDSQFDPGRLRLADLDGSGTADLIYIGRGELCYWINCGGNRFTEGRRITGLPYIDNVSSAQVIDFLGDGTPCLVWSSPLSGQAHSPISYLRLTEGIQPGLLLSADNSMGKVTSLTYATSGQNYLRDQQAGRPWTFKLPNHHTVVERLEVQDLIGRSRYCRRFEYHDGCYDSQERRFQGFGQVDEYDSEVFDASSPDPEEEYTAPACTRTFYHPGIPAGADRLERYPYRGDPEQFRLPQPMFLVRLDFNGRTCADGYRMLAGLPLRQEIFAVGRDGHRAEHPVRITQHAYHLRQLQPGRGGTPACFDAYQSETLVHDYEQNPDDPRVTHHYTLEVDSFGHALQTCALAYARRHRADAAAEAQRTCLLSANSQTYLNLTAADRWELGIPLERKRHELQGRLLETGSPVPWEHMRAAVPAALAAPLDFHAAPDPAVPGLQARLLEWQRHYYWDDAAGAQAPWGNVGSTTLLHHQAAACFSPPLLAALFADKAEVSALAAGGHYHRQDGYWWQAGPVSEYAPRDGFFSLRAVTRLDGGVSRYQYDPYCLCLIEIADALGNCTRAEIDYHVPAPWRTVDPNRNIAEVRYDPLGMIVVSTAQGQVQGPNGAPAPYGHGLLADYRPQADWGRAALLAEPERFLQDAAQYIFYDVDAWHRDHAPLFTLALLRGEWVYDGAGNTRHGCPIQIVLDYTDGFGRGLQHKQRVEPGPAVLRDSAGRVALDAQGRPLEADTKTRWRVSGSTVYNNKQLPVRRYEPFFSAQPDYEGDAVLRRFGAGTLTGYDCLGRSLRERLPNGTLTRTELTAWQARSFDSNDTVLESPYAIIRELLPAGHPERKAYEQARSHADTPVITHFDPLGREILRVETSRTEPGRAVRTRRDIQGQALEIVDARGLTAFAYQYDMLGRVLYEHGMDSGDQWTLDDALGQPHHHWDGRGVHLEHQHDLLGRLACLQAEGLGPPRTLERLVYGDDPAVADGEARNARGRIVSHYDQAGVAHILQYSPDGQVLARERRLAAITGAPGCGPDWTRPDEVVLEPAAYDSRSVFDALGRLTQQDLPDQTTRALSYLPGGGLDQIKISTADGGLTDELILRRCAFNARGQRTLAVLGNGIEIRCRYDPGTFRLARLTAHSPGDGGGRAFQDVEYTYDPAGNVVYRLDHVQEPSAGALPVLQGLRVSSGCEYTHDAFYQLRTATGRVHQALLEHDCLPGSAFPGKGTRHISLENAAAVERYTRTYTYDPAGNLESVVHRGDSQNWTTRILTSSHSNRSSLARDYHGAELADPETYFDANGNCCSLPHIRSLSWDCRNRLAAAIIIERPEDEGGPDAEYYVYGSDGLRLRKQRHRLDHGTREVTEKIYLEGCEIKRVWRGGELVLERITSQIADGDRRCALLHRWRVDRLQQETSDLSFAPVHYQLSNQLGSAVLEVNERAEVLTYEEYFPYGNTAFIAGNLSELNRKDYRYSGKERDEATGLYDYGYRYYASWLGNWLSPDPLGPVDGLNLYRFAGNNPVTWSDPDGLERSRSMRSGPSAADIRRRNEEQARELPPADRGAPLQEPQPPARGGTMPGTYGHAEPEGQAGTRTMERTAPVQPAPPPPRSDATAGALGRAHNIRQQRDAAAERARMRRERTAEAASPQGLPQRLPADVAVPGAREAAVQGIEEQRRLVEPLERVTPQEAKPHLFASEDKPDPLTMTGPSALESVQQYQQELARMRSERTDPVQIVKVSEDGTAVVINPETGASRPLDPAATRPLDPVRMAASFATTLVAGAALMAVAAACPPLILPMLAIGIGLSVGLRIKENAAAGNTGATDIAAATVVGVLDITGLPCLVSGISGEDILTGQLLAPDEREENIGAGAAMLTLSLAGVFLPRTGRPGRIPGRIEAPGPEGGSAGAARAGDPVFFRWRRPVRLSGEELENNALAQAIRVEERAILEARARAIRRLEDVRRTQGEEAAQALQAEYDRLGGIPDLPRNSRGQHQYNLAAARYLQTVNGETRSGIIVRLSAGRHGHSEYQIAYELELMGIEPTEVLELHTLLAPCSACEPNLLTRYPFLYITYSFPYNENAGSGPGVWKPRLEWW